MIVKVCGVRTAAIAAAAVEAGADWIGLIFVPESPRWADDAAASEVRSAVAGAADLVGVFVAPDAVACNRLAARHHLASVQLHGDVGQSIVVDIDVPVIRALNVSSAHDAFTYEWWPDGTVLLDAAPAPGDLPGGTGRSISLEVAAELARHRRILLAGGLRPSNVASVVAAVRPWGVDASSGLERTPGVKDASLVRDYVAAARAASQSAPRSVVPAGDM